MSPTGATTAASPTAAEAAPKAHTKDLTGVEQVVPYPSYEALSAALLSSGAQPPSDNGTVSLLVQRPEVNERRIVDSAYVSKTSGMTGSGWVERPERGNIDQICVMSTAAIRAIAGEDQKHWAPAGDQIFMDLDLCKENLKVGDRVKVGEQGPVLEVTSKPHNGCAKFAKRFGEDALRIVNAPKGKEKRLRGIYFCVAEEGVAKTGDKIVKVMR